MLTLVYILNFFELCVTVSASNKISKNIGALKMDALNWGCVAMRREKKKKKNWGCVKSGGGGGGGLNQGLTALFFLNFFATKTTFLRYKM